MTRTALNTIAKYIVTSTLVGCIVLLYVRLVHVNATTVALSLLIGILFVSATWGLQQAIYMSALSALAFNYFFLPPIYTFSIGDTQNWIAFLAFLITGIVASQLSERARRETLASNRRRHEIERLYAFSQELLVSGNVIDLLTAVPANIEAIFGLRGAALYLAANDCVYRSGADFNRTTVEELCEALQRFEHTRRGDITLVPLRLGLRPMGVLAVAGPALSPEMLDAIGGLIAIAIERASAVETLSKSEAAREGERLRNALIDSVTHELRTPLTSIVASITSLRSHLGLGPEQRDELMAVIEEESGRLNRLIGQAVEMAELDTREVKLELAPHTIREAMDRALAESAPDPKHPIHLQLPENLPSATMDLARIAKVLQHLLENAAKYSPEGSPILVSAEIQRSQLVTSVADQGAGVAEPEQKMIFEKFYRGRSHRYHVPGTGMGLAIVRAIVEAHGGTVAVTSQPGQGSVFSFALPIS